MHRIRHAVILANLLAAACPAAALGDSFDPRIITFGSTRQQLQNTPITQRPDRPLHVYGNVVRRRHRRSGPAPQSAAQVERSR